jgi:predicted alpha/beta hydrolase family esterase
MAQQLFPEVQVILVPGLHDSGPDHWQSRWQRARPEFFRVVQDDWDDPDLAAWSARLDQVRARDPRPALFVAHSFGCLATVHSIAHHPAGVAGALLVAPADPHKFGVAAQLPAHALPCPTIMVSSSNDPWMHAERAAQWAARWRSELVEGGALGHINAESGLGDWPAGLAQLHRVFDLAHNGRLAFSA